MCRPVPKTSQAKPTRGLKSRLSSCGRARAAGWLIALRAKKVRLAGCRGHADDRAGRGEALRVLRPVRRDDARQVEEVYLQRRVELEEAAQLRLPQVVHA